MKYRVVNNSEVFAERLKVSIVKSGKRKKDIAFAVGTSPAAISRYVKGDRCPNGTTLVKLAKELNVSSEWLTGFDDKEDNETCIGCAFEATESWEMPCMKCRRQAKDYYRKAES